jgi:hypothetical protein
VTEDPQGVRSHERGSTLMMEHFEALERLDRSRVSARARLEAALGDDLTRLLVGALTTAEPVDAPEELGDSAA